MPRIIGENIRNELRIQDPVSGTVLTIYYRMPTSEERVAYDSIKYQKIGDKFEIKITEAAQAFGEKIILGFPDKTFIQKVPTKSPPLQGEGKPPKASLAKGGGGDGFELKPFSSDPSSPDYDPAWKALVNQYAPDILEALGFHVFEGMRIIASQEGSITKNS